MSAQLETQEAGTGKWFPIIIYTPGTPEQEAQARGHMSVLQALGLYVSVTGFSASALEGEKTP